MEKNIHLKLILPPVTFGDVFREIRTRYPDYNIVTGAQEYQKLMQVVIKSAHISIEKRSEIAAKMYLSLIITEALTVTALN